MYIQLPGCPIWGTCTLSSSLSTSSFWAQSSPSPLDTFSDLDTLTQRDEWVQVHIMGKEFILSLDNHPCKKFPFSIENFEEWRYSPKPYVEETYLAAYLAMWLSGRALIKSSTSVRPETFWATIEMAKGRRYSLAVQHLAWAYITP